MGVAPPRLSKTIRYTFPVTHLGSSFASNESNIYSAIHIVSKPPNGCRSYARRTIDGHESECKHKPSQPELW